MKIQDLVNKSMMIDWAPKEVKFGIYDKYFKKMNEVMKENMRLLPCSFCGAMTGLHGQHRENCIFHPNHEHKIGNVLRIKLPKDYIVNNGEKRMTRNEAVKLLYDIDVRNKPINDNERNYVLIEKLIALGILKLEEEKVPKEIYNQLAELKDYSKLMNILDVWGYEIVKKGNDNAE